MAVAISNFPDFMDSSSFGILVAVYPDQKATSQELANLQQRRRNYKLSFAVVGTRCDWRAGFNA
jgi:hypothetical protein